MFEVPHNTPRANPWRLAALWMGIAVINIVVSSLIYPLLFDKLDRDVINIGLISNTVNLITNLLCVILQWLVLRQFFPEMERWLGNHSLALIMGALLENFTRQLFTAFFFPPEISSLGPGSDVYLISSAINRLFWMLITGLVGWWVFQQAVRLAWLWPAVIALWALGQFLVTRAVIIPMILLAGSRTIATYNLINVAVGLLPAAIQAAVLMQFVRDQRRLIVAESTYPGY